MAYKFVQISDVGFNHSLSTDSEINKYVENLRRESFAKVIDLCIEEKATALLILGNLYDEQHITFENARLIKKSFARLKSNDIAIVYAHGSLDKGYFLDSIENDIIEIKNRYTSQVYSLPFGIDSVCFEGIGYSKRLVFQDEYLEPKKDDTPAVGIMYIDSSLYKGETLELLHRRLEKSPALYWALGGSDGEHASMQGAHFSYAGHLCPRQSDGPGCLMINITNKLKVSVNPVNLCNVVFSTIRVDDAYKSTDIYQLMERCADLIIKSKVPGCEMIVNLVLSGPCSCYNQLVNHREELQGEISKITETALNININNLTKAVTPTGRIEDESHITELLDECIRLYDDEELYNRTINSLKAKRVFYGREGSAADKRKILEGVDSILLESAIKEDGHDY